MSFVVDTFQIGVPGGDCAIHLLVENPGVPNSNDNCAAQRETWKLDPQGKIGTVRRAVLMDGGHDCRPGYWGAEAAAKIISTIKKIKKTYQIPNDPYPNNNEVMPFDSWVVTHWDRDHYCGSLYMIWKDLKSQCLTGPNGAFNPNATPRSRYFRYTPQPHVALSKIFCPSWNYGFAKAHHKLLYKDGAFVKMFIPGELQNPLEFERRNARTDAVSYDICAGVFEGYRELMGCDFFTHIDCKDDDTGPHPNAEDTYWNLKTVAAAFHSPEAEQMRELPPTAPAFVCIGVLGNILGVTPFTEYGSQATGHGIGPTRDNYSSIMSMIIWPEAYLTDSIPRVSHFCGGDAYYWTEDKIIEFLCDAPIEVMKASHHGARSSTSLKLLSSCEPNRFIISAGSEHGHPSWQLVSLLRAFSSNRPNSSLKRINNANYAQLDRWKWANESFTFTMRYPYYFYLSKNLAKIPTARHLNLESYSSKVDIYQKMFQDAAASGAKYSGEAFWNKYQDVRYQDMYPLLFRELRNELPDDVATAVELFFYPYVKDQSTFTPDDIAVLRRSLIKLMRAFFARMSNWKEGHRANKIFDMKFVLIRAWKDPLLDGQVHIEKRFSKYVRRTGRFRNPHVPANTNQITTEIIAEEFIQDEAADTIEVEEATMAIEDTALDLQDETDETVDPDTLQGDFEKTQENFGEYDDEESFWTDLIVEVDVLKPEQQQAPRSDTLITHSTQEDIAHPAMQLIDLGEVAATSPTPLQRVAELQLPETSVADPQNQPKSINGIACSSIRAEKISAQSLQMAIAVPASSTQVLLRATLNGYIKFSQPAAITTAGINVTAALSTTDTLFKYFRECLSDISSSSNSLSSFNGSTSTVTSINVSFVIQSIPTGQQPIIVEITAIDIKMTVGSSTITFTTNADALVAQFGPAPTNSTGLNLASAQLLLARRNDIVTGIAMSDVLSLIGLQVPHWVHTSLKLVKLDMVTDAPDPIVNTRTGIWYLPKMKQAVVVRLFMKVQDRGPIVDLLEGCLSAKEQFEIYVIGKKWSYFDSIQKLIQMEPELSLHTKINLRSNASIDANVTISTSGITFDLMRNSPVGSMQDIFTWIKSQALTFQIGSILGDLTETLSKVVSLLLPAKSQGSNGSISNVDSLSWRHFSLSIQEGKVVASLLTMEIDAQIGVPQGKMATFLLTFQWSQLQGDWDIQGTLWNGLPSNTKLATPWQISISPILEDWQNLVPLVNNRALSISLLHLFPGNSLDIPHGIPTDITNLKLSVGSTGVHFQTTLETLTTTSASFGVASDPNAPALDLSDVQLSLELNYNFNQTSNFSFDIKGTIFLPPRTAVLTDTQQQGAVNAEIGYKNGTWSFSVGASNFPLSIFASLFGDPTERQKFVDIVGHLLLKNISLTYDYTGAKATSLAFKASVWIDKVVFNLSYTRGSGKPWQFLLQVRHATASTVKLADMVEILFGSGAKAEMPTFIKDTEIDLKKSGFEFTLKSSTSDPQTLICYLQLTVGSVTICLTQIRTAVQDAKAKRIIQVSVTQLPTLPTIPVVGQLDQPFDSMDFMYAFADITTAEATMLNQDVPSFVSKNLTVDQKQAICVPAGYVFALNCNGKVVVECRSKPSPKKPKDSQISDLQSSLASANTQTVAQNDAQALDQSSSSTNQTNRAMKPLGKTFGVLTIESVGLDFDSQAKIIKISLNATAALGALNVGLDAFSISIDFSKVTSFNADILSKSKFDWSLDGLAVAVQGKTFSAAGHLSMINGEVSRGFEGGVGVSFTPYAFSAFGAYEEIINEVTHNPEYKSMFVFAMLEGPLMTFPPFIEVRGIRGGFGRGSQLRLPEVNEIYQFPFANPTASDPTQVFAKLRANPPWVSPAQDSLWFAIGLTTKVLQTVDVTALATLQLGPDVREIVILGLASASLPRGGDPSKAMCFIEVAIKSTIDLVNGTFFLNGSINPNSFLFAKNCQPAGQFVIATWFNPSQYSGDWVISFGGYHPAYVRPAHYPDGPARLQISWKYDEHLSIVGQVYFALTPDCLMAGFRISVMFVLGKLSAYFNASGDAILMFHPLHYDLRIEISAGIKYELTIVWATKKISVDLGASLNIYGPSMAGSAYFDFWVFGFTVSFGDKKHTLDPLGLPEFINVLMQKDSSPNSQDPANFVLGVECGLLPPKAAEPQKPGDPWVVRERFTFSIQSRVAIGQTNLTDKLKRPVNGSREINARPMAPGTTLNSSLTVNIIGQGATPDKFIAEGIYSNLSASLWGASVSNYNSLLHPSGKPTIRHLTGVKISSGPPLVSTINPIPVTTTDLNEASEETVSIPEVPKDDLEFSARRRQTSAKADFVAARAAFGVPVRGRMNVDAIKQRRLDVVNLLSGLFKDSKGKLTERGQAIGNLPTSPPVRMIDNMERHYTMAPRVSVG